MKQRPMPIPFHYGGQAALIDNRFKIISPRWEGEPFALYDLVEDPTESNNLASRQPEKLAQMRDTFEEWAASVEKNR